MFLASFAIGQTKPVVHKATKVSKTMKAKAGPHSTTLNWTASTFVCSGTMSYNVYSGASSGGENYTTPINPSLINGFSFVDTNVVPLQTKFYTVKTNCSSSTPPLSVPSPEASGTTPGDAQPGPPTNVTATVQ